MNIITYNVWGDDENEYKINIKSILQVLLKVLIKVAILVSITTLIAYMISRSREASFTTILEYAGIALMLIGASSIFGGQNIRTNREYNLVKYSVGGQRVTNTDIELLEKSYGFCIFMGSSGIIVILISVAIWLFQ